MNHRSKAAVGAALAAALALVGCSAESGQGNDGQVEISFLTQAGQLNEDAANAFVAAFTAENPDIKVKVEVYPTDQGAPLLRTKLATGEMPEVFTFNSGSQLLKLDPDSFLADLSDQDWVSTLTDEMKAVVSTDKGLYGVPYQSTEAGAIAYNKKVYAELGLSVPTSWAEFAANNEKIKAAGKTAVIQTYGTVWTSQLIVLGDFANITAKDPDWATKYTANQRKWAEMPALQSFLNLESVYEAGWMNKDFASADSDEGMRLLASGEGAHYPMLTSVVFSSLKQNYPDKLEDIGVFAVPAQNSADTRLTSWMPRALYVAKSAEGAKLEAAKKFAAFIVSEEGCKVQTTVMAVAGPFATSACTLPADSPGMLRDLQEYFDSGRVGSALEFLSPVPSKNLGPILVEVGSGITPGETAAANFDGEVTSSAQQLGLDGW